MPVLLGLGRLGRVGIDNLQIFGGEATNKAVVCEPVELLTATDSE